MCMKKFDAEKSILTNMTDSDSVNILTNLQGF